ncbi:ATP-binding cassette domain-containing protein [Pseudomonas sp. SZ57]|uniref:ABC transporter ATP-binding protein n=1 Tax=Pseudomonas sp. SZ57 TaxID=2662259 RepID=UPI001291DC5A|nr:ABC transporter ATP-binding protein [Pseudomonas sp. SZ57]MQQ34090.1 ATP-binding cassette domain-containing protein [Pseudomonas sp. SZ57]
MILSVEKLCIRLPLAGQMRYMVRDLSFTVAAGETLGIVGESGCGKSLTNLALMGLLPTGAEVSAERLDLCGRNLLALSGASDWRKVRGSCAAMIFQNPMSSLNPVMTIGAQLAEALWLADPDASRATVRETLLSLLDQVGIPRPAARAAAYPHELSGGMAQRVMIAMALALKPALLIADEPTTALDSTTQWQIMDLLLRLRDEKGMAMMLISHDIGLVSAYADHVQVMYAGELVEHGPANELLEQPRHPYTRGLISSQPGHAGRARKTLLPAIGGQVPSLNSETIGCRFSSRCPSVREQCGVEQTLRRPPGTTNVMVRCIH